MSKWTNLLLDINYMKQYAAGAARVVTIDVSRFGMTDEQRIQDAAMARFQLDKLLLDEDDLQIKWAQLMVHDFDSESIVFRGTLEQCEHYIKKTRRTNVEIYWALPDEQYFSWENYYQSLRDRCNLEIEFMW